MSDVTQIDILEAKQRIEAGAMLVDVREANEYEESHIPGSHLVALSEFSDNYSSLPKDKPLIMQCRSGARSNRAAEFLLANGYEDVVNMAGGILAWVEAGLDTE